MDIMLSSFFILTVYYYALIYHGKFCENLLSNEPDSDSGGQTLNLIGFFIYKSLRERQVSRWDIFTFYQYHIVTFDSSE